MSKLPQTMQDNLQSKCHPMGNHQKYISRITKTLYYGKFPKPEGLSLPLTELAAELFSEAQKGRSLGRLHCDDASNISRNACVSPCSLVLALLYLERLKKVNPDYLEKTAPSDLFLISLMVSCKFLYDDGEVDEVFIDEWALSARMSVKYLVQLEKDFLKAIDWEIFINKPTFWKKLTEIETILAKKQGLSRGFFTYTELHKLINIIELHELTGSILTVMIILITSYITAILTLLGSIIIVSHIPGTFLESRKYEIQTHTNSIFESIIHSNAGNDCYRFEALQDIKYRTNFNSKAKSKTSEISMGGISFAFTDSFVKPSCNGTYQTDDAVEETIRQFTSWNWWGTSTTTTSSKEPSKFEVVYFLNFKPYKRTKLPHVQDKSVKTIKNKNMKNIPWHRKWSIIEYKHLHHYIQNMK